LLKTFCENHITRNPERFPVEFMFQLNTTEENEPVTIWHRLTTRLT
jgi:hypothetical protein